MDAPSPPPRAVVKVPPWAKAVSVVTLLGSLGALIAGVDVGVHGEIALSNELAVAALGLMAVFALLNLAQGRAWAAAGA